MMFDKHRNTVIRESFNMKSLILGIEISQLRCLVCVSRMLQEQLLKQIYMLKSMGRGQLNDHGQDSVIISRILAETVRDFVQTKWFVALHREV